MKPAMASLGVCLCICDELHSKAAADVCGLLASGSTAGKSAVSAAEGFVMPALRNMRYELVLIPCDLCLLPHRAGRVPHK